jgi:uncharacterized Zn finger protein
MLTLDNFDSTINKEIVQRGQQYYLSKSILSLEEVADNQWKAEVEGTEIYTVEVYLKDREIVKYACNCPYDGITCKHTVSVFVALRKDMKKIQQEAKSTRGKKLTMEELLSKITAKELQDFILNYASLNKDFAKVVEIHFAEKDQRIDMRKHYLDIIKKAIKKNSDHGFIDYRSTLALGKEMDNLLNQANAFIQKGKFAEGMLIGQLVIEQLIEVIGDSDDSAGEIGGSLDIAIALLRDMGNSEEVSFSLKAQLYDYLERETAKNIYYEYGDFGDDMLQIAQATAMQIGESERFLKFMDRLLPSFSGYSSDFYKRKFLEYKIEVLQKLGRKEEVQDLIEKNMEMEEIRRKVVAETLAKKDYHKAKQLIQEGIKIAASKNQTGTIHNWEKELLEMAIVEKELSAIRFYTKKFAFEHSKLNIEYYRQWKMTFSKEEWAITLQNIVEEAHQEAEIHSKNKKQIWFEPNNFIYYRLAPVFIEEKIWDKLLEITKKNLSLHTLDSVYEHLVKHYPTEILELYMPLLRQKSESLDGRSKYQEFTTYLKKLKKDIAGSDQLIHSFIAELKIKYARKPAMLDELSKIK